MVWYSRRDEGMNDESMNILVIESSPHKNGSSNLLADNFIRGAEEKGHQVTVFDAARADLHPCLGRSL